jgi:hypothetical protein
MALVGQELAKLADTFKSDCATCSFQVMPGAGASLFNGLSGNAASMDMTFDGGINSGPRV